MSAHIKLRELAERGRAASPLAVDAPPPLVAPAAAAAQAKRCPRCKSAFDELCARDPMPAEYEPRRCECMAIQSWRVPVDGEPGVFERRKVER